MGKPTNLLGKSQGWAPWPNLRMFIPSTFPSSLFSKGDSAIDQALFF